MPEFDLDAALAAPAIRHWSVVINADPNYVSKARLYYDFDPNAPDANKVRFDFRVLATHWRDDGVRTHEVQRRLKRLIDYLNHLSDKHPEKPYYPDYQHLSVWSWVMGVEGTMDDPSIALL